jgi:hypothetical protein
MLPLEDPFQYYPTIYADVFQVVSFPQVSSPKALYAPFLSPNVLHATPNLFLLIL